MEIQLKGICKKLFNRVPSVQQLNYFFAKLNWLTRLHKPMYTNVSTRLWTLMVGGSVVQWSALRHSIDKSGVRNQLSSVETLYFQIIIQVKYDKPSFIGKEENNHKFNISIGIRFFHFNFLLLSKITQLAQLLPKLSMGSGQWSWLS